MNKAIPQADGGRWGTVVADNVKERTFTDVYLCRSQSDVKSFPS